MVLAAIETPSRIVHRPLPVDDPQRRRPDISRAERLLGWRPATPLTEGLPPTIDWFAKTVRPARVGGRIGAVEAAAMQGPV